MEFLCPKEHVAGKGGECLETERAVIGVEALVETHLALEENAADERCGFVAAGPEDGGQSEGSGRHELGVLLNSILKWVGRGEKRRVPGQGERRLAGDIRKECAILRERVDIGGGDAAVAIGSDVVRAQCVDGNQDDRWERTRVRRGGAYVS